MYLSISTTYIPATDLGYLLHKNPAKVQQFPQSYGTAHVFYSEATTERCTAVLLLDIDPIGISRRSGTGKDFALEPYVNDRPYVASSFLSVAIGDVFGTAMAGRSKDKPTLPDTAIPLEVTLGVLPCRGGETFLRLLFEPLGYVVAAQRLPLDEHFPEWGESRYYTVTLTQVCRLKDLLTHLYVLIPVLDNEKHYWVGNAEVDKLLRHGENWLASHPQKEQIVRRYLRNTASLTRQALSRLVVEDDELDGEDCDDSDAKPNTESLLEEKISLNQQRIDIVTALVEQLGAETLVDLGCGEGRLLAALFKVRKLKAITGMDVSLRALEIAKRRLNWDRLTEKQLERVNLLHGSLIYRDQRLAGFDVATVIEVIEHLDFARLDAFERILFEFARPAKIIVTTPNAEFNVKFEHLPAGQFRHHDHRFEWTRAEFEAWAEARAAKYGYAVSFRHVGELLPDVGAPTQLALFELIA